MSTTDVKIRIKKMNINDEVKMQNFLDENPVIKSEIDKILSDINEESYEHDDGDYVMSSENVGGHIFQLKSIFGTEKW